MRYGYRPAMKLFILCILVIAPGVAPPQTPLNLSEHALAFATHGEGKRSAAKYLIDGDPTTFWHGGRKSLLDVPQNVVVKFNKPHTICRVDVKSQAF